MLWIDSTACLTSLISCHSVHIFVLSLSPTIITYANASVFINLPRESKSTLTTLVSRFDPCIRTPYTCPLFSHPSSFVTACHSVGISVSIPQFLVSDPVFGRAWRRPVSLISISNDKTERKTYVVHASFDCCFDLCVSGLISC